MQKLLALIKQHKIITSLIAIALLGGGYFWYNKTHTNTAQAQYVTGYAEKTTITVAVSASGQVSAENQIDLKPGGSGKLTEVNVKTGDEVKSGQVIAVVDQSNNYVTLSQAQAQVLQAQANYDKLIAGLAGSDLITAQRIVLKAQEAIDKTKNDYNQTIIDQQQAVDKAYNTLLNSGLSLEQSDLITTAGVTLTGSYTGIKEAKYSINLYDTTGAGLYYSVSGLDNKFESGPANRGFSRPLGNGLYITFSTTGNLYSSTTWTIDVPNKTSSQYYTNLSSYNTALQNQTKTITTAQDNIKSAEEALMDAQLAFDVKIAPPDNTDVASAKASLLSAQAQLQSASNNYNNNVLKAPFDGIIAALNNKKGEQVTASTVVATIITKEQLATVSLNEVDASKIKTGQKTTLTFDAIENLNLTGQVVEVGSLGTVTQGVVSYAIKIGFDTQDERVKSSMSITADIITDVKTDILAVPSSAIKTDGNGKYVQMLGSNGQPQNFPVEVGISNNTMTEITSGLSDGEQIVTSVITPTVSGASTTRTGTSGISIPGLGGGGGAARGAAQFRGN